MRHPAAQRLRRHVDELDLVGRADDGIRHRLPLRDAGDLLDDVVERLQVLDVHRGDHVDAGVEQLVDVLPALLVARAGHVRVRELVDERDLGMARQDRVQVHLLEGGAAVRQRCPRDDLEVADLLGGVRATMCLDVGDDHVGAALTAAVALVEHGKRLADASRGAEVDPQLAAAARLLGGPHVSETTVRTHDITPSPSVSRRVAVAHTGLGQQVARPRRVVLELAAQPGHVEAQVVGTAFGAGSPQLGQQPAGGHELAG